MLGSSGYLPEVFLQGSTAEISCNWNRYRIKGGTTMNPCLMVPSLRISPISEDHSKTCLVPSYEISSSEHMRSPRFPTCAVGPYPPNLRAQPCHHWEQHLVTRIRFTLRQPNMAGKSPSWIGLENFPIKSSIYIPLIFPATHRKTELSMNCLVLLLWYN